MLKNLLFLGLFVFLTIASYSQLPSDSLIGYWSFSGNANDESVHDNDGVVFGANLTADRFGNANNAYSFNRSHDDLIETAIDDSLLSNYTASGWFNWQGADNAHLFGTFSSDVKGFTVKVYNDRIYYRHGNTLMISLSKISSGIWYHISVGFDGKEVALYLNGEEDSRDTASVTNTAGDFVIGAIPRYMTVFNWDGKIDDVRIFGKYIGESDIVALYNEGNCSNELVHDTIVRYVSSLDFELISSKTYFESIDSLYTSIGGCDSIVYNYSQYVYNAKHFTDTIVFIDTTVVSVQSHLPTEEGLIAHYPFSDGAVDISGNDHHGVLFDPASTNDRFDDATAAYLFNRSENDYILTGIDDTLLTNYTVSTWFKWQGADNSHVLGTYSSDLNGFTVKVFNNRIYYRHGNTLLISNALISSAEWYHIVVRFDGEEAVLYLNGEEDSRDTASVTNTVSDLVIGAIPRYMSIFNWDGLIDDIRVYGVSLEEAEIEFLYQEGICLGVNYVDVYDTIPVYNNVAVSDTLIIDILITQLNVPNVLNRIKMYPNPTRDYVIVNTGNYSQMDSYSLVIENVMGQAVFESLINQAELQVDISSFFDGGGAYLVKIYDEIGGLKETKKLIVQ